MCTQPGHTYNYFQTHRCITAMHLARVNLMSGFDASNVNNSTTDYTEKTCNLVEDLSNLNCSTSTLWSSKGTTNINFLDENTGLDADNNVEYIRSSPQLEQIQGTRLKIIKSLGMLFVTWLVYSCYKQFFSS